MKSQIQENKLKISQIELDYKYLQKLFGSIPQIQKKPEIFQYNYGFFDNFSLLHQPIDKYTPKFGYDLEKKIEYVIFKVFISFIIILAARLLANHTIPIFSKYNFYFLINHMLFSA